jgi:2,4-dienoyl-CoA reductase-like NADH-dependent reductase (Old Yellow Enzyme family)
MLFFATSVRHPLRLGKPTAAVHELGTAASIQLVHCGFFSSPSVIGRRPLGASRKLCLYRGAVCAAMNVAQIEQKVADFALAARMAKASGFDAVELHAGHGYLLSQFLSPWTNRRRDEYGGSLDNRLRFPAAVIHRVREAVGPDFPVLVKMNRRDGFRGGLELDEAVQAAIRFEAAGASALIPSCGFTARTPLYMMRGNVPAREMAANQHGLPARLATRLFGRLFVQRYPYAPLFLLEGTRRIRAAVRIPVVYVGGILSLDDAEEALRAGETRESDCDLCNRCIAAMEAGGVACVSAARGLMPQDTW